MLHGAVFSKRVPLVAEGILIFISTCDTLELNEMRRIENVL
jgi:hypothetical protein